MQRQNPDHPEMSSVTGERGEGGTQRAKEPGIKGPEHSMIIPTIANVHARASLANCHADLNTLHSVLPSFIRSLSGNCVPVSFDSIPPSVLPSVRWMDHGADVGRLCCFQEVLLNAFCPVALPSPFPPPFFLSFFLSTHLSIEMYCTLCSHHKVQHCVPWWYEINPFGEDALSKTTFQLIIE